MSIIRLVAFVVILALCELATGCASHREEGDHFTDLSPLRAGERIGINFRGVPDGGPWVGQIDTDGSVIVADLRVRIAGLTPSEAAEKITNTFVPKYYPKGSLVFYVKRVQPQHGVNPSQPVKSL